MTRTLILAAGLLAASAGAALAQTPPDYTGNLNASPPAARPAAAPPPAQTTTPAAAPAPARVGPAAAPANARVEPASAATPASSTAPAAASAPPTSTPAAPAAAAPAAPRVLSRAEIEALPFTLALPEGYVLTAGRPGPDFQVWTVRKNGLAQLMIYAGPASQFPIHSGEMVEAGGRTTVVVTEEGRRRALEHLFQQSTAPNHIHVWVASLDGPDRDRAEALAHGVSPR